MAVVTATLLSEKTKITEAYELISIDIRRELNRVPYATLVLLNGSAAKQKFPMSDAAYFEPGKEIEIRLRYESETKDATVFKGLVIRHAIEVSARGATLRIEMKDAAVSLTQARKSAVFNDKSDKEVIDKLIGDAKSKNGAKLKSGTLAETKPKHPQLFQYNVTDWDFIVARAEANALWVVANDGEISARKLDLKPAPARKFDYNIDEIYDFELEVDAGSQYSKVQSRGWDIKKKKLTEPVDADSVALSQGNLDGAKLAGAMAFGSCALLNPVPPAPEELKAWADGRMTRSRMSMIRGRLALPGIPDLKLLDVIQIDKVGKRFTGKTLITGICHRVDVDGWRTDIQMGVSPRNFYREDGIQDAPVAGLLPGVSGLQVGVVDKFEADPDKQLRVKVVLGGAGAEAKAVWARLAAPDAGKNRGWFFRPETGDEVVVGFFNDDPRQPVILGAMYSSENTQPQDFSEITEKNLKKGIVTKAGTKIFFNDDKKASLSFETASKNKILLDDDKGLIEISDKNGNRVTLDKNGIKLESAGDLQLTAKKNVKIQGKQVDVK